jgi:hypothetical protein
MQSALSMLMAFHMLARRQLFIFRQRTKQLSDIVVIWNLNSKNHFPPNICCISTVYLASCINSKMPKLLGAQPFSHMNCQTNGIRNPGFKFD